MSKVKTLEEIILKQGERFEKNKVKTLEKISKENQIKLKQQLLEKRSENMANSLKLKTQNLQNKEMPKNLEQLTLEQGKRFQMQTEKMEQSRLENHFYNREKLRKDSINENIIKQKNETNIKKKINRAEKANAEKEVAASIENEEIQKESKMDNFIRKAGPTAIGGGLIFAMCSRNGSMSNSELYGQQRPYGY